MQEKIIVFTRYPEPGRTKTRLAGSLGDAAAAEIQRKLTEHTLSRVARLRNTRPLDLWVYFAGGDQVRMRQWLGPDFVYHTQANGDLGARMADACSRAFRQGGRRVVIIGSDCPAIRQSHVEQALEALLHQDLVIGPASDGGYYLIGLNRDQRALFNGIPWSTAAVLAETLRVGEKLGLSIEILEELADVDRPEDLKNINYHSDAE